MVDRASAPRFVTMPRELRAASANDLAVPDAYVVKALAAMRAEPARRWSVARLARVAGLSRAPFARRFRRATGETPLRWLTTLRLELARRCLVETELTLAAIAGEVGYASEFALSKAFKRHVGVAPAVFRRTALAPPVFRAAA